MLQLTLGLGRPPVIVASMSRSGSTVLYKAIVRGWAKARFGRHAELLAPFISEYAWRLQETPLIGGVVYKTHDLPENMPRGTPAKVIFTYRRASDVAISIMAKTRKGQKFFEEHRRKLGGEGGLRGFARRDSLGLRTQVDRWFAAEGVDLLGIRYDQIWSRAAEIEAFLGIPVALPAFREAEPHDLPDEMIEQLRRTYKWVDRKIEAMPEMFIRRAGGTAPG